MLMLIDHFRKATSRRTFSQTIILQSKPKAENRLPYSALPQLAGGPIALTTHTNVSSDTPGRTKEEILITRNT